MNEELNNLQAEAAAIDQEFIPAGQASEAEQQTAAMDYRAEALGLINFAATLFIPLFPSLGIVYTSDARNELAGASAPLMEKYGWSLNGFFEKWGPEINFAVVAFPLAMKTKIAIAADIENRKAKKEPQPEQQGHAMGHPGMSAEEQTL